MESTDLHLHFPAGAVGKDGPSAGTAITVALVSLFSGECTRSDTAMTGEVTLRGLVLPVGGVKEKVLAAHRAGITHIILPRRNQKDLRDVSNAVKVCSLIITGLSSQALISKWQNHVHTSDIIDLLMTAGCVCVCVGAGYIHSGGLAGRCSHTCIYWRDSHA